MKLVVQLADGAGTYEFEHADEETCGDMALDFIAERGLKATFELGGRTFVAELVPEGLKVTCVAGRNN